MSRWLKSGLKCSVFKGQSTPRSTQTTPTADTTWRNNRLTLLTFNIVITPPQPHPVITSPTLFSQEIARALTFTLISNDEKPLF